MSIWERWQARLRRGTRAAIERLRHAPLMRSAGGPDANILAISDLHLGHDLKRGFVFEGAPEPAIDRPLGAFLEHHAERREGGLPWRLVIVGDAVDFIGMSLCPEPGEGAGFAVSEEERLYGLHPEPAKAEWKLRRAMQRHDALFRRLARFVAAGNEVVVVRGNHDMEWGWAQVRDALRTHLAELAFPTPAAASLQERARLAAERGGVFERVTFRDWFYLESGRFYAEHGHFYDEYSITEDGLGPAADGAAAMREPVSTLALRYFHNKHTSLGLDMNDVERWGLADFVRWGFRSGRAARLGADYLVMCGRVLAFSVKASVRTTWRSIAALVRLGRGLALEDEKLLQIRTMLRTVRDDHEELARGLLTLVRPPAERSVLATAQMLYFDRVVLAVLVMLSAAGCVAADGPALWRGGTFALILAAATAANFALQRLRCIDSHPKLIRAAHRVSVLFRVPFVIMGHSHRVVSQEVGDGARYFNLGTWMAASRDGDGPAGFPHVVVRGEVAELRRWPLAGVRTPEGTDVVA